ncbi:hypothetical protein PSA01_27490 [Pseudonocardia saturnea]|uniref:Uncharacterized protein n=1 Tax=Pseudonocardia saturnea TaxID=33909 RepID=A0ABQ0RYH1_9PSEU|nr:hypothetical protein Pdca_57870 [Pseudonocardia autotrophica]GEC25720.1 hypothetical protein PSA01_27490 [Pseudonocardia saturnea]
MERLDDTAGALAAVRGALAAAWDDAAGREWSDRLDLVRRATDRLAADAAAERLRLDALAPDPERPPTAPGPIGTRTTDRRGVVAPLLPPLDPDR